MMQTVQATVKEYEGWAFATMELNGMWYVSKARSGREPLIWEFDSEKTAANWVQYQMGWLRYWSQQGPPASTDSPDAIAGYQDARADHAKQVVWDKEKAQAWSDEYEEQRNGWMT